MYKQVFYLYVMKNVKSPYCRCLYYSANALARVMTGLADEAFAPTGLPPSYAFVMMSVNGKPGIQPGEISTKMMLAPSTITRFIEKLEFRGLVNRKQVGKAIHVYPTAKGEQMYPEIKAAWRQLKKRYDNLIGEQKARELTDATYNAVLAITNEKQTINQ
jgi:DNA-binding MarR family transcriptional regulator